MALIPVGTEHVEVSGAEKAGAKLAGKTFDKFDGLKVQLDGEQPGTETYVAKVKAALKAKAGGDEVGQDSNGDGTYAGKSLELGKGGRSELLQDRITLELVNKGYSLEDSIRIAKAQAYKYGKSKYGEAQMAKWAAKSTT